MKPKEGQAFVDWLTGPEGQAAIGLQDNGHSAGPSGPGSAALAADLAPAISKLS